MHESLLLVLGLLFLLFLLVMLARKLKVAYPIFLVVAGLGISLIPGVPRVSLNPELVFLIFLPALLYEAAWYMSWKDFWKWRRPISLLAFGLVLATSLVTAYVSSSLIPGFTLALGFLLGGIISPPDAIAAATVMKGLSVPRRIMTILEGESLVNDASSLIVFRFALAAVITGSFSFEEAAGQFVLVSVMGIVVGLAGAHIMYCIHKFLPTTPAIDAALTVMTPYLLFLAAEEFHFSGVLAVVSGGLFISYRAHEVFRSGSTRMNMLGVWTTMIFVMNALVFILIGLELPGIVEGLGDNSIADGICYGLLISAVIIGLRFLWIYPAAFVPRWLFPRIREREASPGWKGPLVIGWAGMRGVVSLATALSIPMMLDGKPFPHRSLIILITFVVIFVTLVFQGLTLPFLIKRIRIEEIDKMPSDEIQRIGIQAILDRVALHVIDKGYPQYASENQLLKIYRERLELDIENLATKLDSLGEDPEEKKSLETYQKILLEIYRLQRKELFSLRKEKHFSDEEIRKAEIQLDLDELRITGTSH